MSDIAILVCSEWQYCGVQFTATSVSGNSSTELVEPPSPPARTALTNVTLRSSPRKAPAGAGASLYTQYLHAMMHSVQGGFCSQRVN